MMSGGSKALPIYPSGPAVSTDSEDIPDEEGWVRRYVATPKKAEEARIMYEDLGFEVLLSRPDPAEMSDECGDCREVVCSTYLLIQTRRPMK